jgi:hypothetical protein
MRERTSEKRASNTPNRKSFGRGTSQNLRLGNQSIWNSWERACDSVQSLGIRVAAETNKYSGAKNVLNCSSGTSVSWSALMSQTKIVGVNLNCVESYWE